MTPSEITAQWQRDNPFRHRCNKARQRAKHRGLDFDIDSGYIKTLWDKQQGKCYYSGIDITIDGSDPDTNLTIDRIDNDQGYVQGNIALACMAVNTMKNKHSVTSFHEFCRRILNHANTNDQKSTY